MGAPNKLTGKPGTHRMNLPRRRKPVHWQLRMSVYQQLVEMQQEGEPLVAVVERVILGAKPQKHLCT